MILQYWHLKSVLITAVLALDLMLPGMAAQERRRRATRSEAAFVREFIVDQGAVSFYLII